jgi:hypothetical protein
VFYRTFVFQCERVHKIIANRYANGEYTMEVLTCADLTYISMSLED